MKKLTWILLFTSVLCKAQITAPDITLTDINGVQRNMYNELSNGKTMVLDFFSIYCGTCITNTPALENIWQTYGYSGDSLWVWGIESFGAHDTAIQTFQNSYGSTFPLFSTLNDDVVIYEYNITYTPQYFVVCPDGGMKPYSVADLATGVLNCKTTPVNQLSLPSGIQVFAEGDRLMLVTSGESGSVKMELFSLMDIRMITALSDMPGTQIIRTEGLTGLYLYRVTRADGEVLLSGKILLL